MAKWSENETCSLIELYGEHFKSLEKLQKKKPIHNVMSEKMREMGFHRTAGQISKKIANLRSDYKKHNPGTTGGETPTWIHYESLHKILHERPSLNAVVAETSEIGFEPEDNEDEARVIEEEQICDEDGDPLGDVLERTPSGPPRKKARVSNEAVRVCSETLDFMKEEALKRDKERSETKEMNEGLLSVLNRIATSAEIMAQNSTPTIPVFPYTVMGEDVNAEGH